MTLDAPPTSQPPGVPTRFTLTAGTVLRRVHHRDHDAGSFNPTAQPTKLAGGRFDSLDGSYAYTYLGGGAPGAIGETLCRDLPLGGHARLVPWAKVHGRQITSVEVLHDVPILALHGAHLTQVHAPLELTQCDADQYDVTRAWAHRLREWFPDIAGFQYRARHDEDSISWVLFDDRPPGPHARAGGSLRALPDSLPLDAGPGIHLLKKVLQAHNATLA